MSFQEFERKGTRESLRDELAASSLMIDGVGEDGRHSNEQSSHRFLVFRLSPFNLCNPSSRLLAPISPLRIGSTSSPPDKQGIDEHRHPLTHSFIHSFIHERSSLYIHFFFHPPTHLLFQSIALPPPLSLHPLCSFFENLKEASYLFRC